jgi:hypothetical protein
VILPTCTFDGDNLAWSGTAILASISIDLWEAIEKDLGYDVTGPKVFDVVVRKQQQVNASLVRALVVSLSKMMLSIEPAQDVEVFGNQITKVARPIEGTGSAHNDISVLLATAFLDSDVLTFQLRASELHNIVNDDQSSQMEDQIVRTLKQ